MAKSPSDPRSTTMALEVERLLKALDIGGDPKDDKPPKSAPAPSVVPPRAPRPTEDIGLPAVAGPLPSAPPAPHKGLPGIASSPHSALSVHGIGLPGSASPTHIGDPAPGIGQSRQPSPSHHPTPVPDIGLGRVDSPPPRRNPVPPPVRSASPPRATTPPRAPTPPRAAAPPRRKALFARLRGSERTETDVSIPPDRTELWARVALWARVVLGVALGVAMTQWPYDTGCGWALSGYLAAVAVIMVAGGWIAFTAWRAHSGPAHILALILVFWGIVLAAEQSLPRTGYAAEQASWSCRAPARR